MFGLSSKSGIILKLEQNQKYWCCIINLSKTKYVQIKSSLINKDIFVPM